MISSVRTMGSAILAIALLAQSATETRAQLALNTAFTYQGSLVEAGEPATGTFDFTFSLHDAEPSGSQVGATASVEDRPVTRGVFTAILDFGAFTGERRWLEIGVRPGADTGGYTLLAPRVELTAAPYALYSLRAGTAAMADDADTLDGMDATAFQDDRPPVAVLESDRRKVLLDSPISGAAVSLSLALSYDLDAGALEYGFDPEGLISGEPSYGSSSGATHEYTVAGTYLAEGWVRDADGQFDVDKTVVEVTDGGGVRTVSSVGGTYTSLREVNDAPAIAYYEPASQMLFYARADDAGGTSWPPANVVNPDATVGVGTYASMEMVGGFPAIAYYDATNTRLLFARATESTGLTTPWNIQQVQPAGGEHCSLAVVAGAPAVAFRDAAGALRFERAANAIGTSWTATPLTLDASTNDTGLFASLAMVAGVPAVAYYEGLADDLIFVRALDEDGSSWSTPVVVDSTDDVGQYASLAEVDGFPAIAYHDETDGDLRYVRALDALGSSWGAPIVVDDGAAADEDEGGGNDVGAFARLAVIDGIPAIAYYDATAGDLKYARASDAEGSVWPQSGILVLDSTGIVGSFTSLAVVNGYPAVSYYDQTNDALKFAR